MNYMNEIINNPLMAILDIWAKESKIPLNSIIIALDNTTFHNLIDRWNKNIVNNDLAKSEIATLYMQEFQTHIMNTIEKLSNSNIDIYQLLGNIHYGDDWITSHGKYFEIMNDMHKLSIKLVIPNLV